MTWSTSCQVPGQQDSVVGGIG